MREVSIRRAVDPHDDVKPCRSTKMVIWSRMLQKAVLTEWCFTHEDFLPHQNRETDKRKN